MSEELNNCRCGGKPEVAGMTTPFASQATAVCRDCGTVVVVRSARKTWEMYPRTYQNDGEPYTDTMRFALADADKLIENIDAELKGEPAL